MERGDAHDEDAHGEHAVTEVVRPGRAAARSASNRRRMIVGGVAALAIVALGGAALAVTDGSGEVADAPEVKALVETTTAPTTVPTAPLTGVEIAPEDAAALARRDRPAVVTKVDNDPAAMPQIGLERADLVLELMVEGISRYMGVFHSNDVGLVGPIRSARTSDPDLLAMFGRPLVAWSGGNPTVAEVMNSTPWIQSFNPDQVEGAYSRDRSKRAPHNLMVDVPRLYELADTPPAVPGAAFAYLPAGTDPGGTPVAGFDLSVGKSPSSFVWDPARNGWARWSNGRRHVDGGGVQHAPTNVVVLATEYTPSPADRESPEARTLGEGTAWVFTQGRMIEGRWLRGDRAGGWILTTPDGAPVFLTPGPTWIQMPETGTAPGLLSAEVAGQRAAS